MDSNHGQQILGTGQPQRLLKAKVRICGRYLLRPEDDFNAEAATELARKSAGRDAGRVRTSLHVYNTGLRLGESGVFASMPLEYIKYQRIAACVAISEGHLQQQKQQQKRHQQQQRLLAICTKDFEQKCVTVLQFKDAVKLAEAVGLIDRQRRLVAEEANYLTDRQPMVGAATSNWAMESAPPQPQQPQQHQQHQQQSQQSQPPQASAIIGGFGRSTSAGPFDRQRPAPFQRDIVLTNGRAGDRGGSSTNNRDNDEDDSVFGGFGNGRQHREIDSVIVDYNDVSERRNGGGVGGATYAVFESATGPPTLLNEGGGGGGIVSSYSSGGASGIPQGRHRQPLRVQVSEQHQQGQGQQRRDYVDDGSARPRVTYVTTGRQEIQQHQQHQQPQQLELVEYSSPQQPLHQQMQLVRLVPVQQQQYHRQPRRHHYYHQQQQQYYALQPAPIISSSSSRSSLSRRYYLASK